MLRKAPEHLATQRRHKVTFEGPDTAEGRLAELHCFVEHCLEDRPEGAGGRIDDLQYFGGGGLLFQRLA
jgi:hypothetical protein